MWDRSTIRTCCVVRMALSAVLRTAAAYSCTHYGASSDPGTRCNRITRDLAHLRVKLAMYSTPSLLTGGD
jgi:hypothetical protein